MPIYSVEVSGIVGHNWTPPVVPVGTPANLTANPLSGAVALDWDPPQETSGLTTYSVQFKLISVTTWSTFAHAASTTTGITVTGLVNGANYDFRVASVTGSSTVGTYTDSVSAMPTATVSTATIFGFNTDDDAPLSLYMSKFDNRAPMVRRYSGAAFNLNGGKFQFDTSIAPEKRVCYSVKANGSGPYTKAGLAAGNGNSMLTDWCESIPANWHVPFVPWHEPNDDIREGSLTISQYRNIFSQFRTAIDNASLQPGVKVELVSNFMAYRVADTPNYFDDSWVPPEADVMSLDIYSNPGHFTSQVLAPNCSFAEGAEYGSSFPNIPTRFRDSLEAIVRNGFKDRWAVLENNSPPRDYDGPANPDYVCGTNKRLRYQGGRTAAGHDTSHTEVERAAHLKGSVDYGLSRPTILGQKMGLPKYWLFWQHPSGVNWNQKFYHQRMWDTLKPYVVGTSAGGRSPAAL